MADFGGLFCCCDPPFPVDYRRYADTSNPPTRELQRVLGANGFMKPDGGGSGLMLCGTSRDEWGRFAKIFVYEPATDSILWEATNDSITVLSSNSFFGFAITQSVTRRWWAAWWRSDGTIVAVRHNRGETNFECWVDAVIFDADGTIVCQSPIVTDTRTPATSYPDAAALQVSVRAMDWDYDPSDDSGYVALDNFDGGTLSFPSFNNLWMLKVTPAGGYGYSSSCVTIGRRYAFAVPPGVDHWDTNGAGDPICSAVGFYRTSSIRIDADGFAWVGTRQLWTIPGTLQTAATVGLVRMMPSAFAGPPDDDLDKYTPFSAIAGEAGDFCDGVNTWATACYDQDVVEDGLFGDEPTIAAFVADDTNYDCRWASQAPAAPTASGLAPDGDETFVKGVNLSGSGGDLARFQAAASDPMLRRLWRSTNTSPIGWPGMALAGSDLLAIASRSLSSDNLFRITSANADVWNRIWVTPGTGYFAGAGTPLTLAVDPDDDELHVCGGTFLDDWSDGT